MITETTEEQLDYLCWIRNHVADGGDPIVFYLDTSIPGRRERALRDVDEQITRLRGEMFRSVKAS